jgi:hypothetical protein
MLSILGLKKPENKKRDISELAGVYEWLKITKAFKRGN